MEIQSGLNINHVNELVTRGWKLVVGLKNHLDSCISELGFLLLDESISLYTITSIRFAIVVSTLFCFLGFSLFVRD